MRNYLRIITGIVLTCVITMLTACQSPQADATLLFGASLADNFKGHTIGYNTELTDRTDEDGNPILRITYVYRQTDGKTRTKSDDIIFAFVQMHYGFRGLMLETDGLCYHVDSINANYEENTIISDISLQPEQTTNDVRLRYAGTEKTFTVGNATIAYDTYLLAEPSENGNRQLWVDLASATVGDKAFRRDEVYEILHQIMLEAGITVTVDGKTYPVETISASTVQSGDSLIPLSTYFIIEVPVDTKPDAIILIS